MIRAETDIKVQFYDVDLMQVVWHGNYARFLEHGRCALMERIGYSYLEMARSGYTWPIVDLRIKYLRPIRLGQRIRVVAELVEYENRICIDYRIMDAVSDEVLSKAHTTQLAVEIGTGELAFSSPRDLTDKVRGLLP